MQSSTENTQQQPWPQQPTMTVSYSQTIKSSRQKRHRGWPGASAHKSPPACSSSCPPAPCPGRRAAGPCTARTAACAAPTAPAGRRAPPRGWPAARESTEGGPVSPAAATCTKGCLGISNPRAGLQARTAPTRGCRPSHRNSHESGAACTLMLNLRGVALFQLIYS